MLVDAYPGTNMARNERVTPMLEVRTAADGSVVIRPHGAVDVDVATELRQALVHSVRRLRPSRLVVDLSDASDLDSINVGTLAAACDLGDDHRVAVFVENSTAEVAADLTAAGVPEQRLRGVAEA
jgi:anti-anti-sigma factor